MDALVLSPSSRKPERHEGRHGRWTIANQNCELALTDEADAEPSIELRPVFTDDPPPDWGIRSARFRLTDTEFVRSTSPRPIVSPALVTALVVDGASRREPSPARELAFTTWLGLRYDRPAVPTHLVPLADRIAEVVRKRSNRPFGARVRDVLMQFDDSSQPVLFSLYAVLEQASDSDAARQWLSEVARGVPAALGVADVIEATTAEGISFHLIETSYAADVTQVTWRLGDPEPEGAT